MWSFHSPSPAPRKCTASQSSLPTETSSDGDSLHKGLTVWYDKERDKEIVIKINRRHREIASEKQPTGHLQSEIVLSKSWTKQTNKTTLKYEETEGKLYQQHTYPSIRLQVQNLNF